MGGKSHTPSPPDPYAVSKAQTGVNQSTAQYNANLNRNDITTPYGSQTWTQTGTNPDGSPKWTSNFALTGQYATPLDTSSVGTANQAAQDAVYKRATATLDPQYQQLQTQLNSQLASQGITQGSDAWNTAQANFARQRDSAYENARNDSITQGDQYGMQQLQQLLAIRNQPLAELQGLESAMQFQKPATVSTPASNLSGDIYNSYQGSLDAASSKNAGSNALMGGLFSLGGSAIGSGMFNNMFSFSDRRLKKDVVHIGERGGLPLYLFRYLWEDGSTLQHVGHMADEVAARVPDAVVRGPEGFDLVNYARVEEAAWAS